MAKTNGRIYSATRKEYEYRLSLVLEYINSHLGDALLLNELSRVACFSQFHFHRFFSAMVGETPADYVRRLRLERAANWLLSHSSESITDVAFSCGFSSSSLFSRLFRDHFNITPLDWRKGHIQKSKNSKMKSKNRKAVSLPIWYVIDSNYQKRRERMQRKFGTIKVEVKNIPAVRVAYVKHLKGYKDNAGIGAAFQKLFFWAGPRGFMNSDVKVMGMSLDNPDITPEDKCRYYACLTVGDRAEPEGEVGVMNIAGGKYAVAHFAGNEDVFKKAYDYMYGCWLPGSGYQCADEPAFELYANEPDEGAKHKFVFDLHIPVKPL